MKRGDLKVPFIFVENLPDDLPDGFETVNAYSEDDYNNVINERDTLQQAFDTATETINSLQEDIKKEKAKFAKAFLDTATKKKNNDQVLVNSRKPKTVDNIWG